MEQMVELILDRREANTILKYAHHMTLMVDIRISIWLRDNVHYAEVNSPYGTNGKSDGGININLFHPLTTQYKFS